jgi:uncharacterized protein (TIGR02271 family)
MTTTHDPAQMRGMTAVDGDGDKLGRIEDIYLDEETGKPEWMAIQTGVSGGHLTFVPLADARQNGDTVTVPYDKAKVNDAPRVDADRQLSQDEEAELYRYFGLDYSESRSDSGLSQGDGAMTRSEEELHVGTASRQTGTARLRKYVVTEHETHTVPVQREEARIEREPITDANADEAMDGPAISEEEHEVVLHAEEPVVEKRTVPKERVRLDKDVVRDEQTVSGDVRQERIEVEGDRR